MQRILSPDDLYRRCDPSFFSFRTTANLPPLEEIIGQQRAVDAIDFGLNLKSDGFNIYVLGESGTGRTSAIRAFISKKAEKEIVPPDWCYVNNFREPGEPIAIRLEPGRGAEFQREMHELIASLRVEVPTAKALGKVEVEEPLMVVVTEPFPIYNGSVNPYGKLMVPEALTLPAEST